MREKIMKAYSFPCWMIFTIINGFKMPVPYVEGSEDGYAMYIEPTQEEGVDTIEHLKRIRKTFPDSFPGTIGEMLVPINNMDELSLLVSQTEKKLNIQIEYVAHTLRISKSGDQIDIDRVFVSMKKFLNRDVISTN